MITSTSLLNVKFAKRIKRQLWLAQLESMKTGKRCTQYVKNRNGNNCLRLDVKGCNLMAAYASGSGSKDFSGMIKKTLDNLSRQA